MLFVIGGAIGAVFGGLLWGKANWDPPINEERKHEDVADRRWGKRIVVVGVIIAAVGFVLPAFGVNLG